MSKLLRVSRRRFEKKLSVARYIPLLLCVIAVGISGLYPPRSTWSWLVLLLAGALTLLGLYDLAQRSHAVRRNYPIIGNLRWLFESIRPEIRQYLIEGDNEQAPFSRSQRSLVYARSKNEGSELAFGEIPSVHLQPHADRSAPQQDPSRRSSSRRLKPSSHRRIHKSHSPPPPSQRVRSSGTFVRLPAPETLNGSELSAFGGRTAQRDVSSAGCLVRDAPTRDP